MFIQFAADGLAGKIQIAVRVHAVVRIGRSDERIVFGQNRRFLLRRGGKRLAVYRIFAQTAVRHFGQTARHRSQILRRHADFAGVGHARLEDRLRPAFVGIVSRAARIVRPLFGIGRRRLFRLPLFAGRKSPAHRKEERQQTEKYPTRSFH